MKEQLRLTNLQSAPTLKAGAIFMAEPKGDNSPRPPETKPPLSLERRQEIARKAWERSLGEKIKELPFDTRQATEAAIEIGAIPEIAGGAPAIPGTYTDPLLRGIIEEYDFRAASTRDPSHPDIPLSRAEIQRFIERIENLRDNRAVDVSESMQLINYLKDQSTLAQGVEDQVERLERTQLLRERGGAVAPKIQELAKQIGNFLKREKAAGENITDEMRQERQQLERELIQIIEESPLVDTHEFPRELLELAADFKEAREMLLNTILFKPFQDKTETNEYRLTLYAEGNRDVLLGNLSHLSGKDKESYSYYLSLENAASLFHGMNGRIIAGNLEEFIRVAERISYQHFELMKQIPGVSEAMRLFEQKYLEYLARDKRISTEGYKELKDDVEKTLKKFNDQGLLESTYGEERGGDYKMKEWELQRALNVARTFFNITFRGAEQIGSGQVPREPKDFEGEEKAAKGEKRYASFPQESAVRIINWIQWLTYRFGLAAPRGGMEFLKMAKEEYFKFLEDKKRKLGVSKIEEFGGMNVKELEVGAMFGVSGIYSSWRMETMAFPVIQIQIDNEKVSVRKWIDDHQKEIKDAEDSKDQDVYLEALSPLIENINAGLGILLKHSLFQGEIGYKARERIWQRVVESNLPLMINYLTGLKIADKSVATLENIKSQDGQGNNVNWDAHPVDQEGKELPSKWDILKDKILLYHERQTKENAGIDISNIPAVTFEEDEARLISKIRQEAVKLAPHLADIVFPYIPFMNDIPFEKLTYEGPGEEFYKRRTGSDIPSYNKAEGAFTAIMSNPGGIGVEEGLKQFSAIEQGIESPQGTGDAQERVFPMFSAWLEFITTKPGERQIFFKGIKELLRMPTSLAQKYADMSADSIDEHQAFNVTEQAVKLGIISVDLAKELRKKKHLTLLWRIIALIRDFFAVPFVVGGVNFVKATVQEKA